MRFVEIKHDDFWANRAMFREALVRPLYRGFDTPKMIRQQYRDILRGIRDDRVRVYMLATDDKQHCLGVMTWEKFDDNMHLRTLAGDFRSLGYTWIPEMILFGSAMARYYGKAKLRIRGRPGWKKLLKPYGFMPDGEYLTKLIEV